MKLMINSSEPKYGVVEDYMIMDSEPVLGDWVVNAKAHSLVCILLSPVNKLFIKCSFIASYPMLVALSLHLLLVIFDV